MKKLFLLPIFLCGDLFAQEKLISVHRWFQPQDRDWITIADTEIRGATLASWGYHASKFQFLALEAPQKGLKLTRVKRWWHPVDKDWLTVGENEISDQTLFGWGYRDPKFQFYAFKKIPKKSLYRFAKVYRWWHPQDRDWVSLRDGEISDKLMKQWGYQFKSFQFFVITGTK